MPVLDPSDSNSSRNRHLGKPPSMLCFGRQGLPLGWFFLPLSLPNQLTGMSGLNLFFGGGGARDHHI